MHTSPDISLSFNCEVSFPADQVRFWGQCVNRCVTLLTRKNSHKCSCTPDGGSNLRSLDLESDAVPIEPHRQFIGTESPAIIAIYGGMIVEREEVLQLLLSQKKHFVKYVISYFKIM